MVHKLESFDFYVSTFTITSHGGDMLDPDDERLSNNNSKDNRQVQIILM